MGIRRSGGGGYWKKRGRGRNVVSAASGRLVVGTRQSFVFYVPFRNPKTRVRTDWFMYQYSLTHHPKASFLLCRVFIKSHHVNNLLEHVLSSCAEEIVPTVRHVEIQHDGTVESATAEAKGDGFPDDCDNGGSNISVRLIDGLDDVVSNYPHPEPVSLNTGLTAQEFSAILEDDFIELDDLVNPLPGID